MYWDPSGNISVQVYPNHWEDIDFGNSTSWDAYKKMSSQEQEEYLNRYIYDDSGLANGHFQQKATFQQSLKNSVIHKINVGVEAGVVAFAKKTFIDGPKYIAQTCYDVYGHPIDTYNQLKTDIEYCQENPNALREGVIETGKQFADDVYTDFKAQVLYGDATSRSKYFAEHSLDAIFLVKSGQNALSKVSTTSTKVLSKVDNFGSAISNKRAIIKQAIKEGKTSYNNALSESYQIAAPGNITLNVQNNIGNALNAAKQGLSSGINYIRQSEGFGNGRKIKGAKVEEFIDPRTNMKKETIIVESENDLFEAYEIERNGKKYTEDKGGNYWSNPDLDRRIEFSEGHEPKPNNPLGEGPHVKVMEPKDPLDPKNGGWWTPRKYKVKGHEKWKKDWNK